MRDQAAVGRFLHEGFVDVVGCEIAGDAGKEIDVALADGLAETGMVADGNMEIAHNRSSPPRDYADGSHRPQRPGGRRIAYACRPQSRQIVIAERQSFRISSDITGIEFPA